MEVRPIFKRSAPRWPKSSTSWSTTRWSALWSCGRRSPPAQRSVFVDRAKENAQAARDLVAKLAAEEIASGRVGDQLVLAQGRASILEELARPLPDANKVRTLGSDFVVAHVARMARMSPSPLAPSGAFDGVDAKGAQRTADTF